jgi:broad specificity phosphatase PhoE
MPSHAEFVAGVREALDHVRANHEGAVLIVSSGGPIATAVAEVLGAPNAAAIELNMRIRNSAVTEFVFSEKRHSLLSFNTLPHLLGPERADWITYS